MPTPPPSAPAPQAFTAFDALPFTWSLVHPELFGSHRTQAVAETCCSVVKGGGGGREKALDTGHSITDIHCIRLSRIFLDTFCGPQCQRAFQIFASLQLAANLSSSPL